MATHTWRCCWLIVFLGILVGAPAARADRKPRDNGEMPPPKVVPGEKVTVAYMDLGRKKLDQGDLKGAVDAFTKARDAAPKDATPLYLRGAVYQKMKRLSEAEADFRAALALSPRLVDVRAELGAILTDSGRAEEAVEVLTQAVKEKPDHFEAQYNLGVASETLGRWPEAAQAYGKAAQLRPKDADVRLNLAAALRKSGKLPEALVAAREAVQLAPDDAQAHLNLGLLLSESKRMDDAVAELTAATRLQPGLQKAWWRLGVVQLRRNQPREAIAALERARSLKPTPEVLTDLGKAQRKLGEMPAAEVSFRSALRTDAKYQPARLDLAWTLASTGRCKEGIKELEAVPAHPEYTEAINRIRAQCQFSQDTKKKK